MQSSTDRYLCCFQKLWSDFVWTCSSAISKFPDRLLDLLEGWCILTYIVCRDCVCSSVVKFWELSGWCMVQHLLVMLIPTLKHFVHRSTGCPVVIADWNCASLNTFASATHLLNCPFRCRPASTSSAKVLQCASRSIFAFALNTPLSRRCSSCC